MPKTGKVIAIIQARLGSTRLPMKSLLCLRDVPVIDWVTRRLGQAARLDGIMVAVPDTPLDVVLLEAARKADAGRVVRVCADNPLIWGGAVDRLVDFYDQGGWDYAYNHIPRNNLWPDGLGAEILSRDLLDELDAKATQTSQREHCLNYIWDNATSFKIGTFDPEEDWLRRPDLKLDMDRPDDFCRLALKPITPEMDAREIVRVFG